MIDNVRRRRMKNKLKEYREKLGLTEEKKAEIDFKIRQIQENIKLKPKVSMTYFVATKGRNLGFYKTIFMAVKKIEDVEKQLILEDNASISFADIFSFLYGGL